MKIIDCLDEKNKANFSNIVQESKIYDIVTGDFIVKALFKFRYQNYMCFVMEYQYGGDFSLLLEECGRFSEKIAKFYLAELVLAIEHLHHLQIVHRDLKPENILLAKNGHIKLTDFGLSQIGKLNQLNLSSHNSYSQINANVSNSASSYSNQDSPSPRQKTQFRIIGTPDYIAPEIILHSNAQTLQSSQIDIWSLGIIAFEFLIGVPPFNDESIDKIFANIVKLNLPWDQIPIDNEDENCISELAKDFISGLLVLNPEQRLTIAQIKAHPFFRGIVWEKLLLTQPPIIPQDTLTPRKAQTADVVGLSPFENYDSVLPNNENSELPSIQSSALRNKIRYDLLDLENQENLKKQSFLEQKQKIYVPSYHFYEELFDKQFNK